MNPEDFCKIPKFYIGGDMKEETKFVPSQAFRCNLCGIIYWESELIKNEHIGYLCQECTFHWRRACKALKRKIIKSKKRKERKGG